MANTAIHFEWSRGLDYEIVGNTTIRQTRRTRDRPRPLDEHKTLYLKFAALDSPDDCLEFARSWGLLTEKAHLDAWEPLALWRREIRLMKSWLNMVGVVRTANSRRVEAVMTSVDVGLGSGEPDAKPTLVLRPRSLRDAMLVQLALSRATGNSLAPCEQCGNPFEVGASAKRVDAKFCSDECRARFHNQRRGR